MKVSKIYGFYGEITTSNTKITLLINQPCNCYKWFDHIIHVKTSEWG